MATKHHTALPIGALISILLALAIGSVPIAAFFALEQTLSSVEVAR